VFYGSIVKQRMRQALDQVNQRRSDNQACAKGHEGRLADAGPTALNDHTTTTRRPFLSKHSVSESESFAPIKKEQSARWPP
jgi:hypothetical protein